MSSRLVVFSQIYRRQENLRVPTIKTIGPYRFFFSSRHGTEPEQRQEVQIIGDGEYLHWPQVDEDLTVSGLLRGTPAPSKRGGQAR